jgi:exonuclease SbcD
LAKVNQSSVKYVIIIAGNHDSIATLKAPQKILQLLNIFVITSEDANQDEIIKIYDDNNTLKALICGVAFLRDGVVRKSVSSQTSIEKSKQLTHGIIEYYKNIYKKAKDISSTVPIITTGHFTTVGAKNSESEREIYIGGTLDIDSSMLSQKFDYVALGHLHINQKVQSNNVRYSGSPIPLSFSEGNSIKKVNIVEFKGKDIDVQEIDIPTYRELILLKGDLESLTKSIKQITDKDSWIEVHIKDDNPLLVHQKIRELAEELELNILAIKIEKQTHILHSEIEAINLDDLSPTDIFRKRISCDNLDKELEDTLINEFKLILDEVRYENS